MKFPIYLKKNLLKPIIFAVLSTGFVFIGIFVYFLLFRNKYMLAGCMLLTGICEILCLVSFMKKYKKVSAHITNEFRVVNHSVEELSHNEFEQVSKSSNIN